MIRMGRLGDEVGLHRLLKLILNDHATWYPEHFGNQEAKYDIEAITQLIENPRKIVYVFDVNSNVLGYLIAWVDGCVIYVDDLCIDPQARNQGAAQQLLDRIVQHGQAIGMRGIQLNVWMKNEAARAFYDKHDFEVLKEVRFKKIS